jgi:hypothetical protein
MLALVVLILALAFSSCAQEEPKEPPFSLSAEKVIERTEAFIPTDEVQADEKPTKEKQNTKVYIDDSGSMRGFLSDGCTTYRGILEKFYDVADTDYDYYTVTEPDNALNALNFTDHFSQTNTYNKDKTSLNGILNTASSQTTEDVNDLYIIATDFLITNESEVGEIAQTISKGFIDVPDKTVGVLAMLCNYKGDLFDLRPVKGSTTPIDISASRINDGEMIDHPLYFLIFGDTDSVKTTVDKLEEAFSLLEQFSEKKGNLKSFVLGDFERAPMDKPSRIEDSLYAFSSVSQEGDRGDFRTSEDKPTLVFKEDNLENVIRFQSEAVNSEEGTAATERLASAELGSTLDVSTISFFKMYVDGEHGECTGTLMAEFTEFKDSSKSSKLVNAVTGKDFPLYLYLSNKKNDEDMELSIEMLTAGADAEWVQEGKETQSFLQKVATTISNGGKTCNSSFKLKGTSLEKDKPILFLAQLSLGPKLTKDDWEEALKDGIDTEWYSDWNLDYDAHCDQVAQVLEGNATYALYDKTAFIKNFIEYLIDHRSEKLYDARSALVGSYSSYAMFGAVARGQAQTDAEAEWAISDAELRLIANAKAEGKSDED